MKKALLLLGPCAAAIFAAPARDVSFRKLTLTEQYWCDGVNAADINRDGHVDIIAGPFWYEGPSFRIAHAFYEPVPQPVEEKPTNSMFSWAYDFNGDGWPDILVLGRVLFHEAYWYENPGKDALANPATRWKRHFVSQRVFGESPQFLDIDGDGKPEILAISGQSEKDKLKQWAGMRPTGAIRPSRGNSFR